VCFLFFFKSRGGGAAPDFVQGGKTLRFFLFSIPHMLEEKEKKKVHAEARKETTRPTNRVPTRQHLLPIVFTNSLFCFFYLRNCNLPTAVLF
jgi:hypothetical protein